MNVIEAYTKFNEKNIILISGLSGSNKTKIAKFIAKLFKFQLLNLETFKLSVEEYDKEENYIEIKDNEKILNWNNIYKSINWNKFNETVNLIKKRGVVIYGLGFPDKLLDFKPDFHINLKINKQNLMMSRAKYLYRHSSNKKSLFNSHTFPLYLEIVKESTITRFINLNELKGDQIKDAVFKYLIDSITNWLNKH